MRADVISTAESLQAARHFERLRKILLSEAYTTHRHKPLISWALPSDRRLPLVLLDRTLEDLLQSPFVELSAIPGIGHKKLLALIKLLSRAVETNPIELASSNGHGVSNGGFSNGFDPSTVSEVVWGQWCACVVERHLESEPLGRYAPSLKRITRVIWNTPLGEYTHRTLAEIRGMKTHGEERIHAILRVFHGVYTLVSKMGSHPQLVVRIVPKQVDTAETWTGKTLQTPGIPGVDSIRRSLVQPLLEQIAIDAGPRVVDLADARSGIGGAVTSVRQAARNMGITRARIYQLLDEINDMMTIRWPTGRHQMYELRDKFVTEAAEMNDPPDLTLFLAALELFYPGSRRGASGPLENTLNTFDANDREAFASC